MRVQEFISKMNREGGLARSNRYKVTIIPPVILGSVRNIGSIITGGISGAVNSVLQNRYYGLFQVNPVTVVDNLEFFCENVSLPGLPFETTETKTYGPQFKDPTDIAWEDVSFSFYCSSDMKERYFFDAWQYSIKDPVTNDFYYNRTYSTQVLIRVYSEADDFKYGIRLVDAYPISVNATEMSFSEENAPLKLDVTLTYKNWFNLKAYDTVVSSVGQIINGIGTGLTPNVSSVIRF